MGDFLQLSVKGRETDEGLWDLLKHESDKNELKEKIGSWLKEAKHLAHGSWEENSINPVLIGDTIRDRVCEIAGHVWIEFIEDAGDGENIRGLEVEDIDTINANVAEFVPKPFDMDDLNKALGSDGGEVGWHDVAEHQLRSLFSPLMQPSQTGRNSIQDSGRRQRGAFPGAVEIHSPGDLLRESKYWFDDRRKAHVTQKRLAPNIRKAISALQQEEEGLRYSFTPEYYFDADNCLTFASKALDRLFAEDWLETLRTECGIDRTTVTRECHDDSRIREWGLMKCMLEYSGRADEKRRSAGA